jgi:desulfoferrodoxin-like iron-binding protein
LRIRALSSRSGRLKEADKMAVEQVGERYRCNICGNEVEVLVVGGGTLVCCGEEMERIE